MCAIVDNDVVGEVFGDTGSPAGRGFFNWLNSPHGRLVVGGKLLQEIGRLRALQKMGKERRAVWPDDEVEWERGRRTDSRNRT